VYIIVKIGHAIDIQRFNISTPKSLIATRLFIFFSLFKVYLNSLHITRLV